MRIARTIRTTALYSMVLVCLAVLLSACGNSKPNDLNWEVEDFQYTDQDGQAFGLADLKNKVWLADFIFTYCITVCPPMTENMTRIQQDLKDAGVEAEIVSFTVDPQVDSPEVLKKYIGRYNADESNWRLLTGFSDEEIKQFAEKSFKSAVQKDPDSDQVLHGISFFLVDQSGTIVTKYNGLDPDYKKIVKDVKSLTK